MIPLRPAPARTIEQEILERFRKAANSPEGLFRYPTGREGLRGLGYPAGFVDALPDRVAQCYCGVGNPFMPLAPEAGLRVLDVGCGAGVDALAAAYFVGSRGRVTGLEFSPHMLARAQENLRLCNAGNISLLRAAAEKLPFADASFDLLISNGVYNLVQDKAQALAEARRVLRPGGLFKVADQILDSDQAPSCPLPAPGQLPSSSGWAC